MNTNKKVVLIVLLGVGASLLSFFLSNHFSQRNQRNQSLLSRIERLTEKVEIVRLLSKDFIQSGESDAWQEINKYIESLQHSLSNPTPADNRWSQDLDTLTDKVLGYYRLLKKIHDPVLRLNEAKGKVQRIGSSFSTEIRYFIIIPYRKDEGERIYQGKSIDPIKTRIKETAYDLVGLHNQQQLILIELMLDWDLERYREKKEVIAAALEKHKAQLHYLNVLMGREPVIDHVIRSLETKMNDLVKYEQQIVTHFTQLYSINSELSAEGEDLLFTCNELSTKIASEMSYANRLNRNLNWALLAAILTGLSLIGTLLARDIIHIVDNLRITQFAFDNVNVGIHRNTSDARYVEVNKKYTELTGYSKDELETMSIADVSPSDTSDILKTAWQELKDKGEQHFENILRRKDGSTITIEISSSFLEYQGQEYAFSFVQDITERKRIEASLQITQFAFDNASIGIHMNTMNGMFKKVNHRFAQNLGYSKEELETMSILDLDPSISSDEIEDLQLEIAAKNETTIERIQRRKDGTIIPVEVYTTVLKYEGQAYTINFVQDITERKRMERALKESQERLELALEGANEGIWVYHMDEDVFYFDSRYYTMAGYQPDEFPGTSEEWARRVHKDDIDHVYQRIDQYLRGELDAYESDFRFLCKDGSYMWIQTRGRVVAWDDQGNPKRFTGTHVDITERKKAEEALQENEHLLSNILESMNEGLLVLDSDFNCKLFNQAMGKMVVGTKANAIGKPPWDAFPALKNSSVERNIKKTMAGEPTGNAEIQLPSATGELAWFRDSFSPLKNDVGRIVGVVGVVSDITQRKQDEEELRRLRNYLSNIIDSMPSAILAVDRDGKVTQWNNRTEQMTGLRFEDVRNQPLPNVFPRLSSEMARITTSIKYRRVIRSSKVPRKIEDETRFEDITIFPLVANGVDGAVIRMDDVTEQVRLEEMMIQSEKNAERGWSSRRHGP